MLHPRPSRTLPYYVFVMMFQAEMYAGSLFIQELLGWNIYLSSVVILGITAIYTIGGEACICFSLLFLQLSPGSAV